MTSVSIRVSPKKRLQSLAANYKNFCEYRHEFLDIVVDDQKWYVRIRDICGNDNEFLGGEYLLEMDAPVNYPFEPPTFKFLTENGVYKRNAVVCVSIGEYHKANYATMGMAKFAENLVSGMIGWRTLGGGINIINTDVGVKQAYAVASKKSNFTRHPDITKLFDEFLYTQLREKVQLLPHHPDIIRQIEKMLRLRFTQ